MSEDGNSYSVQGFIVWGIAALFFTYEFLLRTITGTFQLPISYDLHLTAVKFSLLSTTVYMLTYGLMQIPVGIILDRIGLKKTLSLGTFICTIALFFFANATTFTTALIARFFIGIGSSFGFICLIYAVFNWMPKKNRAFMIGVSQFIGTLGPMLAAKPMIVIVKHFDLVWQDVFLFLSGLGVVFTLLVIFFVRDKKKYVAQYLVLKRVTSLKQTLKKLFLRKQPWLIGIFAAFIYLPVEYFSENEGANFINLKGFDIDFASMLITISWLGFAIGCPLLGFLSDIMQKRKQIIRVAAIICLLSLLYIIFGFNRYLLLLSFFGLGIGTSGHSITFALISENFPKANSGLAVSINNALITGISAIVAPVIGFIIDATSTDRGVTFGSFYSGFSVLIVMSIVSLLLAFFAIRETYGKSKVEFTILSKP